MTTNDTQAQGSHDPQTLPSLRYWTENKERRAQRFYVMLCLALASIHDHFVAAEERRRKNLNWSATMAYYSMVHAARFLCFLAFGDFPTNHAKLAQLMTGCGESQLNWLKESMNAIRSRVSVADAAQQLVGHLRDKLSMSDVEQGVAYLGKILNSARKLRNDSNYEALLIAHETHHIHVGSLAKMLASDMADAAAWVGDFLARALVAEIDCGPHIPTEARAEFRGLAQSHFGFRMNCWIGEKLTGETSTAFQQYAGSLGLDGGTHADETIESYVLLPSANGLFRSKQSLMDSYGQKIRGFRELVSALSSCSDAGACAHH